MIDFISSQIQVDSSEIHVLEYPPFEPSKYYELLTDLELERCLHFGNEGRKREFVATRILRHALFGFQHIHYTAHGAPYVQLGSYISISHCKNKVAIATNDHYQIGLDLEIPRPNIEKIMHKFVAPSEFNLFNCTDPIVVSKIWSAKEALYKLAGRRQIHFKEELLLQPESDTIWNGKILNGDHELHVKLNIFEQDGVIFTLNTAPIERIDALA